MVIDDSLLETAEQVLANWKEMNHESKFRSRGGTEATKLIIGQLTPRLITALREAQSQTAQIRALADKGGFITASEIYAIIGSAND
jgi:SH3-like domain-containing protein